MNSRILALVALALGAAFFLAWRATNTAPPTAQPDPIVEDAAPTPRAVEPLTPTTRAPVTGTPTLATDTEPADAPTGCTVRGRVVDQNGRPVARRDVWMMKADRRTPTHFSFLPENSVPLGATADDDGRFTITGIASGTWWIGPCCTDAASERPEQRIAAVGQVIVIDDSMHEIDVQIRAGRGLYLRGTLIDRRGRHPQRGLVRARELESGLLVYTSVNKDGLFELGPLRPGRYEIAGWSYEADASSEPIFANAGEEGLELKMRPGSMMTGSIVDENGTRVFASLRLASRGVQNFPSTVHESLRDGSFRVRGLDPGDFDIVATTSSGRIGVLGPIRLTVGDNAPDLVVAIAPGGTVRVRHEGPELVGTATLIQGGRTVATVELRRGAEHDFPAMRGSGVVRIEMLETGRVVESAVDVRVGQTVNATFEAEAR